MVMEGVGGGAISNIYTEVVMSLFHYMPYNFPAWYNDTTIIVFWELLVCM